MIFFGTDSFSISALKALKDKGIIPTHIVTVPDKPQGRKLVMTPPLIKIWAEAENIPVLQFEKLNTEVEEKIKLLNPDIFVVASYGKIIPERILDISLFGALNIHPSLLPKYRGSSPLQYTILNNEVEVGVTIIKMDKEMDHGPIVDVKKFSHEELIKKYQTLDIAKSSTSNPTWPFSYNELESVLAHTGGEMIAKVLTKFISGDISEKEQDHSLATFTKKIEKEDGLLNTEDKAYLDIKTLQNELQGEIGFKNFLKYKAFIGWPGISFFIQKGAEAIRIKVKDASWDDEKNQMNLLKLIPDGKNEMSFKDFINYLAN